VLCRARSTCTKTRRETIRTARAAVVSAAARFLQCRRLPHSWSASLVPQRRSGSTWRCKRRCKRRYKMSVFSLRRSCSGWPASRRRPSRLRSSC
jgi:hypothetical protein